MLVIVAHGVVHGAADAKRSRKRHAGKMAPADSNRLRDGSVTGSLRVGPFHVEQFACGVPVEALPVNWQKNFKSFLGIKWELRIFSGRACRIVIVFQVLIARSSTIELVHVSS